MGPLISGPKWLKKILSSVVDLARFIKPPSPGESPIFRSLASLWRLVVSETVSIGDENLQPGQIPRKLQHTPGNPPGQL